MADVAQLPHVPEWLLDDLFDCDADLAACGDNQGGLARPWEEGAFLFAQRMAAAPVPASGAGRSEWGAALQVYGFEGEITTDSTDFPGTNHRVATELDGNELSVRSWVYEGGAWVESLTATRSAWRDDVLLTLVPFSDLDSPPYAWDTYARVEAAGGPAEDSLREAGGKLREIFLLPWIDIYADDFFQD